MCFVVMMKKLAKNFLLFVTISCVFFCSCGFIDNNEIFSDNIDYVELINNVTLVAMKSNVKIISGEVNGKKVDNIFLGSGAIIKKKENKSNNTNAYYCVTNNHVVAGNGQRIFKVYDYCGVENDAELLFSSVNYDLAVLKFESKSELLSIKLSETNPSVGDVVVSVGQPESQLNAITVGEVLKFEKLPQSEDVSSKVDFDVVVHNAYINNGSSGGMLLNKDVELVGVNYAGLENKEGESLNEYLAVPVLKLIEFLTNNNFKIN